MRALLFPLTFVLAAQAVAQSPMATAQKLAEAERKATIGRDWAWFDKNTAQDYVEIKRDGRKIARTQSLSELKSSQQMLRIKTLTAKVLKAKMVGANLVTTVSLKAMGAAKGPDGKDHAFEFAGTTEETWTKVGGVWKMKIQKALTESVKVDGQKM